MGNLHGRDLRLLRQLWDGLKAGDILLGDRAIMPRKLRIEFEEAICHVLNRGGRRAAVFRDEASQKRFLEPLAGACAIARFRAVADSGVQG